MKDFVPTFDNNMDLSLATDFLRHNKEIHSIGWEDEGTFEVNDHGIKIFYSKYDKKKFIKKDLKEPSVFFQLADLIEENGDLFCQLETLIRDIPVEDVKKFDLELIKQNLMYQSMYSDRETTLGKDIVMSDESPLASLGCIVYAEYPVTIRASRKTVPVCSLFVNLCEKAGLQGFVNLCLLPNVDEVIRESVLPDHKPVIYLNNISVMNSGCVGVVTGNADVDSAVDAFLFASDQLQWRVKTIYVQENIINQFKSALEWKCSDKPNVDTDIQKAAWNVYQYENKLFLYEYVGSTNKIANATIIDAYRTVKELIGLLKYNKSMCASVWSNDVAESNEISHNINSNIVWINGYGHIDNSQTANTFYSIIHRHYNQIYENYLIKPNSITIKNVAPWAALNKRARYEIITKWLQKIKSDNLLDVYNDRFVIDDSNSSVSVGQQMCISIRKPIDFLFMPLKDFISNLLTNERLSKYLVDGGVIFLLCPKDFDVKEFCKDAHIDCVSEAIFMAGSSVDIDYNYHNVLLYTSKVIWSSIGTVFAN